MLIPPEIVPSSARSAASSAIPLPTQLVPLLSRPLEQLKAAVDKVLPPRKKRTALEEAEYEEEEGDGFEKEMMLQCELLALSTCSLRCSRGVWSKRWLGG
jgi:hypothetical protein